MATILPVPKEGKVVLYVRTGTSAAGNPVTSSRTFTNIKSGANDEDIHAVAIALNQLMKYNLIDISRIEINDLVSLS